MRLSSYPPITTLNLFLSIDEPAARTDNAGTYSLKIPAQSTAVCQLQFCPKEVGEVLASQTVCLCTLHLRIHEGGSL